MELSDWNDCFPLPRERFVAGHTKEFILRSFTPAGVPLDISETRVAFALLDYTYQNSSPVVAKDAGLLMNQDGTSYCAKAFLTSEDTLALGGLYTYQFTITDPMNNCYVGRGLVMIDPNAAAHQSN